MSQDNYSDNSLSLCLDNYWLLFEGILPGGSSRSNTSGASYTGAKIIKADIDSAINALTDDCRWNDVLAAMDAYYSDGLDPSYIFHDDPRYYHMLGKYQKAIVRYHFKVTLQRKNSGDYLDEGEFISALRARQMMLRYLNGRITPREWHLVSRLVQALHPDGA